VISIPLEDDARPSRITMGEPIVAMRGPWEVRFTRS
jgi:hypothetical protein